MKNIAILDRNVFALAGLKYVVVNLLRKRCAFAGQDSSDFVDRLYFDIAIDSATIHFQYKYPEVLLAINSFTDLKGSGKLIVLLENKDKCLLNLMRCMNVSWVAFLDDRVSVITRKINQIHSHTEIFFDDGEKLNLREVEVLTALLSGLSIETVARKMCLSIKTVSAYKKMH